MNEIQQLAAAIAGLDLEIETIVKPIYKRRDELLKQIEVHFPAKGSVYDEGYNWQADDGTVFEIEEKDGKYVHFDRVGWARTRRGYLGEKKGALSKKRAEEVLGYDLGTNYAFVEQTEAEAAGEVPDPGQYDEARQPL